MVDVLEFDDLTLREVPVRLGTEHFILREADEGASCIYRNATMSIIELKDGKPHKLQGLADTESLLVSLCLFYATSPPSQALKPVPIEIIRSWKPSIVRALYKMAKDISDLSDDFLEKAKDKIKNAPSDTPVT